MSELTHSLLLIFAIPVLAGCGARERKMFVPPGEDVCTTTAAAIREAGGGDIVRAGR